MPEGTDYLVADTATRILADLADPQTVNGAKDESWKRELWRALDGAGLSLAWVPEALGGAGASAMEGFAVIGAAGRFALAVPLAETLAAGWLLARASLEASQKPMTVAPVRPHDRIDADAAGRLSGRARNVPFAREVGHIAVIAVGVKAPVIALVDVKDCRVSDSRSLSPDGAADVVLDGVRPLRSALAPAGMTAPSLLLLGAVIRSVQTAGALETVLALSVDYANARVAFERPIGKFQAIQQNLARLAGEVAAALAVAGSAADTIAADAFGDAAFFEAASAKIRTAEAATEAAAIAHQVFGAIGFTNEHVLHRFTLRMLAWRDDFGSESHWAAELGRYVAGRGADQFWPLVAAR